MGWIAVMIPRISVSSFSWVEQVFWCAKIWYGVCYGVFGKRSFASDKNGAIVTRPVPF